MEFEDEHDEEQEEEDDDNNDEITIPPPAPTPTPTPTVLVASELNSVLPSQPRVRRSSVVRYRECLKNHAINIGGHALDGCGEFMPAGQEGTLDALKCAACNCHRNFHRKETVYGGGDGGQSLTTQNHHRQNIPSPTSALYPHLSAYYRTLKGSGLGSGSGYGAYNYNRSLVPVPVPTISGGNYSGDDMSHPSSSGDGGFGGDGGGGNGGVIPRKRFRTKFSQEQKDKMLEFAEKLGWRIQKHDQDVVQQFCDEIQVKRQVLKVWMHNNKLTLGKKTLDNL